MKISKEEVEHVARLARLDLSDAEVDKMTSQLDTILQYVAKLDELDTTGVAVTTHTQDVINAFRDDEVRNHYPGKKPLLTPPGKMAKPLLSPRLLPIRPVIYKPMDLTISLKQKEKLANGRYYICRPYRICTGTN